MKTTPISKPNTTELFEVIKLGIDVHKHRYVVVRKVDGSLPQRPRSFSPETFLSWVRKQRERCQCLYSCYEAGAFGYGLHRKLEALGVINYVICPVNWDDQHKRVKTDGRDATQLALVLDAYLRGNDRSFSIVRVPSEAEEQLRSLTRLRQALIHERSRNSNRGRSYALYFDASLRSYWWAPRRWKEVKQSVSDHLIELLRPVRALILELNEQIGRIEHQLEQMDTPALPKGMGLVLFQQTEREVGSWNRFDNAKQVGGYTGLCPSESSSAERRRQGSVTKHGNPRLRHMLIECAWLLIRWNSGYRGVEKWREKLLDAKLTRASKKKIVVAIARQFAVDWWRVRTGRVRPEDIGLNMKLLKP